MIYFQLTVESSSKRMAYPLYRRYANGDPFLRKCYRKPPFRRLKENALWHQELIFKMHACSFRHGKPCHLPPGGRLLFSYSIAINTTVGVGALDAAFRTQGCHGKNKISPEEGDIFTCLNYLFFEGTSLPFASSTRGDLASFLLSSPRSKFNCCLTAAFSSSES